MLIMAPRPFAPSDRAQEKRINCYMLRLTDTERAILERAAAKQGVTAINLIRQLLADGLAPLRKPRR